MTMEKSPNVRSYLAHMHNVAVVIWLIFSTSWLAIFSIASIERGENAPFVRLIVSAFVLFGFAAVLSEKASLSRGQAAVFGVLFIVSLVVASRVDVDAGPSLHPVVALFLAICSVYVIAVRIVRGSAFL